jgi:hypothetical protein
VEHNFPILRKGHLADKIVIVDGQAGCGKTMLSPIISALERVELLTYAYELEHICALCQLGKMEKDAAQGMVRMLTDLQLYNTMMARETNFRPSDLSSIWRDLNYLRYLKRLFSAGDEHIPGRIKQERPILHLTTHNLLPMASPVLEALGERVVFIEVVRHPLYMLKQQALNMERLVADVRDFTIYFEYKGHQLPFFARGWEEQFVHSNPVEKSIYGMLHLYERAQAVRVKAPAAVLSIPFEPFVLNPSPYMERICSALDTRITESTKTMMRRQKVPRARIADGIALQIYKRCGWKAPEKGADEHKELENRRAYAQTHASKEAMAVLDRLSADYESKYLTKEMV